MLLEIITIFLTESAKVFHIASPGRILHSYLMLQKKHLRKHSTCICICVWETNSLSACDTRVHHVAQETLKHVLSAHNDLFPLRITEQAQQIVLGNGSTDNEYKTA